MCSVKQYENAAYNTLQFKKHFENLGYRKETQLLSVSEKNVQQECQTYCLWRPFIPPAELPVGLWKLGRYGQGYWGLLDMVIGSKRSSGGCADSSAQPVTAWPAAAFHITAVCIYAIPAAFCAIPTAGHIICAASSTIPTTFHPL